MPKRKLVLNHDSATVLLGVRFIMCIQIFLFLLELSNYVTSVFVGAIAVPFKYIGNKTSTICTRYATLIFFILFFVTYAEYLGFKNLVAVLKVILDLSIRANLSHFITGI